jgi:hypothetical protein
MEKLFDGFNKFHRESSIGTLFGYEIFPDSIEDSKREPIFNEFYEVALEAFGVKPSKDFEKDVFKHIFCEDWLQVLLLPNRKKVLAWMTSRNLTLNGKSVIYYSGGVVRSKYQGFGFGNYFVKRYLARNHYDIVAFRTQNPVAKEACDNAINKISHPNGVPIPMEIKEIGIEVAKSLGMNMENYNPDTMISRGCYGASLYGYKTSSRTKYYSDEFGEKLNEEAGDAMICVAFL